MDRIRDLSQHCASGPVVRINPYELHVSDPDFYDELYTGQTRKRNKLAWSADMFIVPGSMLSTIDHDLHRKRRAPLAPYFSLSAIRRFDPVIRGKLEALSRRLDEYRRSGQPVNLDLAFTALTTDIITQYAFGRSDDLLKANDFNPEWLPLLREASEQSLLTKQMPWLMHTMRKIPLNWMVMLKPELTSFIRFQAVRFSFHLIRIANDSSRVSMSACMRSCQVPLNQTKTTRIRRSFTGYSKVTCQHQS